ncbi:MAG: hypothetical protein DMG78_17565 [Acidobacteria bacterium]|nr:MAG: hypothetical protein DMG78_17565 [Acidobacteriota bacterium]
MVVNCQQVWKEISNYIEGDLDAGLRVAMEEHFGTCTRCKSVLEGTQNVVRLYSDERMIEVPTGFGRRLERRLAQGARVRRHSRYRIRCNRNMHNLDATSLLIWWSLCRPGPRISTSPDVT